MSNATEPRPTNDLDFQAQLTEPFISSEYVKSSFRNKFVDYTPEYKKITNKQGEVLKDVNGFDRLEVVLNSNGTPVVNVNKDLYTVLEVFMRDWRLGNIDKKEEAKYIRYYIDLACDILVTMPETFRGSAIMCIERALCINETSQSKNGFLRKLINTFIQKTDKVDDDKPKRNLFGMGKKSKGSY